MAILATGNTFSTGDSVTATMLNNAVNNATFDTGAVDNSTTQLSGGAVIVKDGGITASKLSTGGPTWTSGGALTATSIQNSPIGSSTPASGAFTSLSASSTSSFYEIIEKAGAIGTALGGTVNFNFLDRAINYYTADSTSNWTLNVRGDASTTLDSLMSTGVVSRDCVSIVVMATNGSTAYYQSAMTIDGNAVTPKWAGGTAPTAGNANSVDIYTFTIIKTASATFSVFATQTKFA
jgi:hypothetical protein